MRSQWIIVRPRKSSLIYEDTSEHKDMSEIHVYIIDVCVRVHTRMFSSNTSSTIVNTLPLICEGKG